MNLAEDEELLDGMRRANFRELAASGLDRLMIKIKIARRKLTGDLEGVINFDP